MDRDISVTYNDRNLYNRGGEKIIFFNFIKFYDVLQIIRIALIIFNAWNVNVLFPNMSENNG
jgi:hypothetical protein